ncbi:vacuolar protein sorting-associated protein vps13 [Histomonas meleagridis]|uniref:vacuolar protein sorting-associated protein vps13 n=1 Tax=Histomonas meleagridis TaxID=135588 RepID=UPI003559FAEB|nr:vacuolar protein sorting-associated protein vps13 [Histomonas meleagridis]KAH0800594.1 vacuolar protein sorting-associated protein vps13 [Histomonas meleagridis]
MLALRVIPDITNGHIVLPAFEFEECTMSQSYVQKEIISPIIKSGISQGVKLLFKTDIFMASTGNKSSNFAKSGNKIDIQSMGSTVLFSTGEAALNVASKLLHFVSFDSGGGINRVNTTAKQAFTGGIDSFKNNIVDGFTGIIMQPIRMAKEHGAIGAFLGIGKGLIGVVTKPIAGIVDVGLGSFSAARKFFSGQDEDVIPPVRLPRAMPMIDVEEAFKDIHIDNIEKFKDFMDGAQFAFQIYRNGLYEERIEMFVMDLKSKNWFALTQRYLFVVNNELDVVESIELKDVKGLKRDGTKAKIVANAVIKDKEIEIEFTSMNEANSFLDLARYKSMSLSIGE